MIKRALLICLGTALTLLGLVGLLVPVLPGVLLLGLAAVCFCAISPRLEARLRRHPAWRGWRARWRESRGLSPFARARLAFWLSAEALLNVVRNR